MSAMNRRHAIKTAVASAVAFSCMKRANAASVDANASGTVPPLRQPSTMTCWATVATIMYSWKNGQSFTIPTALAHAGANYVTMFNNNQGLSGSDKAGFLTAMGLRAEGPQNFTADGWAHLIAGHGPLWVTTNEGTHQNFSIHARVMTAIFGDGTGNGTTVTIVDPADGRVHTESLTTFVQKFEDVARIDLGQGADLRPQVVHY